MVGYLRAQQFTEQNGWRPADPVYGAWGMGGGRRTPPDTGHVDISMTRYVLEALRAAGTPSSDPLFAHARIYLQRCQNFDPNQAGPDGGFFFSTTEADTNKAGQDGPRFRRYGSTTADGIAEARMSFSATERRMRESTVRLYHPLRAAPRAAGETLRIGLWKSCGRHCKDRGSRQCARP